MGACVSDCVYCDTCCVVQAMGMSGQKLFGVPIMLQPTMAEKNRYAVMGDDPHAQTHERRDHTTEHPHIVAILSRISLFHGAFL